MKMVESADFLWARHERDDRTPVVGKCQEEMLKTLFVALKNGFNMLIKRLYLGGRENVRNFAMYRYDCTWNKNVIRL